MIQLLWNTNVQISKKKMNHIQYQSKVWTQYVKQCFSSISESFWEDCARPPQSCLFSSLLWPERNTERRENNWPHAERSTLICFLKVCQSRSAGMPVQANTSTCGETQGTFSLILFLSSFSLPHSLLLLSSGVLGKESLLRTVCACGLGWEVLTTACFSYLEITSLVVGTEATACCFCVCLHGFVFQHSYAGHTERRFMMEQRFWGRGRTDGLNILPYATV